MANQFLVSFVFEQSSDQEPLESALIDAYGEGYVVCCTISGYGKNKNVERKNDRERVFGVPMFGPKADWSGFTFVFKGKTGFDEFVKELKGEAKSSFDRCMYVGMEGTRSYV